MNQGDAPRLGIGIIGCGRVGATIGAAWRQAGHAIIGVSATSEASLERAEEMLHGVPVLDPDEITERAELVLIAVPDDEIAPLVTGLPPRGSDAGSDSAAADDSDAQPRCVALAHPSSSSRVCVRLVWPLFAAASKVWRAIRVRSACSVKKRLAPSALWCFTSGVMGPAVECTATVPSFSARISGP